MLRAHMDGYLDLSKDIDPLLESLIFKQIEIKLNIETSSIYPIIDGDNHLYYVTKDSFDTLRKIQTPWLHEDKKKEMSIADKIAMLNKLNNEE